MVNNEERYMRCAKREDAKKKIEKMWNIMKEKGTSEEEFGRLIEVLTAISVISDIYVNG